MHVNQRSREMLTGKSPLTWMKAESRVAIFPDPGSSRITNSVCFWSLSGLTHIRGVSAQDVCAERSDALSSSSLMKSSRASPPSTLEFSPRRSLLAMSLVLIIHAANSAKST